MSEVRRQWEDGTLWDYRRELAVPRSTKAATLLGLAAFASGTVWAVADAARTAPANAAVSALLALVAGLVAVRARMRIGQLGRGDVRCAGRRRRAGEAGHQRGGRRGDENS